MGKKKKSKHEFSQNVWDLTPEEQSKRMEMMHEMEDPDFNILSLSKNKGNKGINKKGFSSGLESEIVKDLFGRASSQHGSSVEEILTEDEIPVGKTNMEELIGVSPIKSEPKSQPIEIDEPEVAIKAPAENSFTHAPIKNVNATSLSSIRRINFNLNKVLNRLIVDDGIAPTSYSFDIGVTQELAAIYDASEISEMLPDLMLYFISLKHPTAVYEYDDFMNRDYWKFGSVKNGEFDYNKYLFFEANGYVFCYLLNNETIDEFNEYLDSLQYNESDILRTYISLAYATGTMHQAFFVEEESYVKLFMKSEFNHQKEFHKIFTNDMDINFVPNHEYVVEEDGVEPYNLEDLHIYVREMIGRVTGTSYFGDDDGWDGEDDPDDDVETGEVEINDHPEKVEEASAEDLLSDNMEIIEEEKPEVINATKLPPSNNNDDFIIDVVRKNKQ